MSQRARWSSVLVALLLAVVVVAGPIYLVRRSSLTSGPRLSAADIQALAQQPPPTPVPTARPRASQTPSTHPTASLSPTPRTSVTSTAAATPAPSPTPAPILTTPSGDAPAPASQSATSVPVRLDIAAIGVHTTLESLGLEPDGALQPPAQWQQAGWYSLGIRPGDPGPAVIAGHVDSTSGPAVFYNLRNLAEGDTAVVTRADGSQLTFVVDAIVRYPKNQFPTQLVYGPTAGPQLRLITCTGNFDRQLRSYVDNLVVALHLQ